MADIFISYAREDETFVKSLNTKLASGGFDVWVDFEDLLQGAEWLNEIYSAIESADLFIFVVSADSLLSEPCNRELDYAIANNKRIIPLILEKIEGDIEKTIFFEWFEKEWFEIARNNWQYVKAINWVFFTSNSVFEESFQALINTFEQDSEHAKTHTRLLVRAKEWEGNNRDRSYLLTDIEIDNAENWLRRFKTDEKGTSPNSSTYRIC